MSHGAARTTQRIAVVAAAACLSAQLGSGCATSNDGPRASSSERSSLGIPCDPNSVLQAVCQRCHSSPPQNGAPFPLVTYQDTQVPSNGVPLWKFMRAVVQSGAMPLPPVQMDTSQRDLLLAWFDAGAPSRSATDMCSEPLVDNPDAGSDANGVSNDAGGDEADASAATSDGGGNAPESGTLDGGALQSDAPDGGDAVDCGDIDACATDGDDAPSE